MATNSVTWDIGDGWMLTTIFGKKVCYLMDLLIRDWLLNHQSHEKLFVELNIYLDVVWEGNVNLLTIKEREGRKTRLVGRRGAYFSPCLIGRIISCDTILM